MTPFCFRLYCEGAQAPIQHEMGLSGQPTLSRPSILALGELGRHSWCLIAEEPGYLGLSATNGIERYIAAVCRALQCAEAHVAWFELDSLGGIDTVTLHAGRVQFAPVRHEGANAGSFDALRAVLAKNHAPVAAQSLHVIQLLEEA